jgi:hypothetical protein
VADERPSQAAVRACVQIDVRRRQIRLDRVPREQDRARWEAHERRRQLDHVRLVAQAPAIHDVLPNSSESCLSRERSPVRSSSSSRCSHGPSSGRSGSTASSSSACSSPTSPAACPCSAHVTYQHPRMATPREAAHVFQHKQAPIVRVRKRVGARQREDWIGPGVALRDRGRECADEEREEHEEAEHRAHGVIPSRACTSFMARRQGAAG